MLRGVSSIPREHNFSIGLKFERQRLISAACEVSNYLSISAEARIDCTGRVVAHESSIFFLELGVDVRVSTARSDDFAVGLNLDGVALRVNAAVKSRLDFATCT